MNSIPSSCDAWLADGSAKDISPAHSEAAPPVPSDPQTTNSSREVDVSQPAPDATDSAQSGGRGQTLPGQPPADWSKDSSLDTWFPFTAREMASLRKQIDSLRDRVGFYELLWLRQNKATIQAHRGIARLRRRLDSAKARSTESQRKTDDLFLSMSLQLEDAFLARDAALARVAELKSLLHEAGQHFTGPSLGAHEIDPETGTLRPVAAGKEG